MNSSSIPLLDMRGIRVTFGSFVANDAVDLAVAAGEIHALLGENGAGKSTLMRVLAGLLVPAAGEIRIDGKIEPIGSAHEAMRLGIGMVHQHFMLVPTLTVAENVCLGLASTGRFIPDLKTAAAKIRELAKTYGLDIDPNARIADLSIAGQQRVEILKALYRGARILILDEPTAVLTPQEAEGLFRILRSLAAQGTAIIFISHKLNEVMALTSKVTVLRLGKVVATAVTAETDARGLARMMVGAEINLPKLEDVLIAEAANGPLKGEVWAERDPILSVTDLICRNPRGPVRVDRVNLVVKAGEIVGVAGVDGNGQQELAEAIVGLRSAESGTIAIEGEDVTRANVARRIALGLAHIPEDRHRTALVEPMSIRDNAVLERIGDAPFSKGGWIDRQAIDGLTAAIIRDFDVRASGPDQPVGTLSGGNQQKVVLGRALSRDPSLLVAVQPARGLDVGATAFVHRQLLARRAAGAGVLLVSTELDEILALSDRIVVMFKGGIVGELARADVTVERLGLMMAGRAA
ncbi:ABC transporter ATP-binding protein [Kaistia dalseonensis]|uniref:Simple sugar transport system ATP-binding protein n=1 Tax=Kaistia dalseonensis TaxID=410840 RepID=A0ABU0HAT1_9HYPH|nr:ABC transporter ATP-binding protein [Kaistia dalseonensis]MCX5496788.1 ABC transporter ATP-binding protein [Kaistia dalseonensis]MDQ0439414.1 simple sugar transport system ATP-binding protein [Kaistia dalseonensis]